jgi:hypothetical protein
MEAAPKEKMMGGLHRLRVNQSESNQFSGASGPPQTFRPGEVQLRSKVRSQVQPGTEDPEGHSVRLSATEAKESRLSQRLLSDWANVLSVISQQRPMPKRI